MIPPRGGSSTLLRALFPGRTTDTRLQHVLEQMPEAALFVAPRSGAFIGINGRAAAMTGWSRDVLLARSLAEVVTAPAAEAALAQIHDLPPGQVRQLTSVPLRSRDGRLVLVDLRLSAMESAPGGETLVLALATPAEDRRTTERRAAQQTQAMTAFEQMLQLLPAQDPEEQSLERAVEATRVMLSADAVGLYRVESNQPGLRLQASTDTPRAFPQSLGPSEAVYLRLPFKWVISQRPQGYLQQAARSGGWGALMSHPIGADAALVGALCVTYRPGTPPPADAAVLLSIAAQFVHQLTTQMNSQAAYVRSRDLAIRLSSQLAAINSQIEEGVLLLNEAGMLVELNSAAARMFGYRSEEVTGLPAGDVLIGDSSLANLVQTVLAAVQAETADSNYVIESHLLRRSGENFPASVRLRALPEGGCVITVRDLSEVRANALDREHLNQLAFVGQASQSFAHEVRGPLNNIAMGVQYLATRMPADEALSQSFSRIQAECSRLSTLMNDMLAWARPVNPTLEPVAIEAIFSRLLHRFSTKIEQHNVRLNFTVEPNCPKAIADARLIEQVFVNLVDNALQAMPAGGHLSVTVGPGTRGQSGSVIEARVADSGPGISDEHRRRIFDPYFTTKPDGTGLGLAICKRLVTVQQGAIGVESFPGSGTIFKVTLPVYTGHTDETDSP
jgi:two-component system nitrogen regulation sensor histidine kinase GlnL